AIAVFRAIPELPASRTRDLTLMHRSIQNFPGTPGDQLMGVLIQGVWRDEELPQEVGGTGDFRRADSIFRQRITADGSSGFKAEGGRYHLYVAVPLGASGPDLSRAQEARERHHR